MQKLQAPCDHQSSSSTPQCQTASGRAVSNSQDEDQIGAPFYLFQQLKRSDPPAAIQFFSEFKIALNRRMDSEDVDLFPAFEARAGKRAKSISEAMRGEHQQIREILNTIGMKLSLNDLKTEAEERALEAALIAHNHRETSVVYSALVGC